MNDTAPIRIHPGAEGGLIVVLPYTPERVAKIKTVLGRRWHAPEKHWTVPRSDDKRSRLLDLFAGDAVELDPSLDGHSAPRRPRKRERMPSSPACMKPSKLAT